MKRANAVKWLMLCTEVHGEAHVGSDLCNESDYQDPPQPYMQLAGNTDRWYVTVDPDGIAWTWCAS